MNSEQIILERQDGIGKITFNNPKRHNAMSLEMWRAGASAIKQCIDSNDTRVIVLTGAGEKAFVAGADISKFGEERNSKQNIEEYNLAVKNFQDTLSKTPIPTIAKIKGYCIGGGLAIALCCDLRIASEDSRFAVPAAKLGLGYPATGIERLMQIVGPSFAMEIFYTARQFNANEAMIMGLVNRIVDNDNLTSLCEEYTDRISSNAPLTIRAVKTAVTENLKTPADRDIALCEEQVAACFASNDYQEGRTAFIEKRKPQFTGT
ncbi:MAG: enoyl-CoA hydratase [Alphaproteobacteria bacterium]|jgi:enoyl-CoA hydratase|nr:enoyl-CoA hydratase [Alphaproteobacteria bacterium]PPR13137.1 MAG: Short-chain-enoyl-CoA hydratase [Alphaproteobacteria bacterium MarineAlpha12_Bin1]|tara:strand:- start:2983 stop:3771 length:789 start_codon:yes stop_codon:yes gene_type:complete